jgi:hypothetical protein
MSDQEDTMTTLKLFAVPALAAVIVGVSGLVSTPSASAAPMTCSQALQKARMYSAIGNAWLIAGSPAQAAYYAGLAKGVMEAAC